MTIKVRGGQAFDTMKEACERLGISRPTMLRYLKEGFFAPPKIQPQGRGKDVRYFDDAWYADSEQRLADARRKNSAQGGGPVVPAEP